MADVNIKKRKLSTEETPVEISDEDVCIENSSESVDVEIVEPNTKTLHLDTIPSHSSDSNLEFVTINSQSSIEILNEETEHVDLKQRLLELDDEIRLLKVENEELKLKSCSCQNRAGVQKSVVTISFNNIDNFRLYKDKLIELFGVSLEFSVTEHESDLLINIVKDDEIDPTEWVVVDEDEIKTINGRPHKKKKKKSKTSSPCTGDENDLSDLFVLDTTPSLSTKNNLKYESKFSVLNSPMGSDKDKQSENKSAASTCFNCNESHNLRDCPKPKNYGKINAARQKFKSHQVKSVRYHIDDDQRFGHLYPGKISENLKEALGLQNNEVPHYIYRMRQLGYPPGWFNEIVAGQQSELVLFNFEGKEAFKQKKNVRDVDVDKIVEYPGFNVPLSKGVRDEHRLYGCPSYSKAQSKASMLEHVRGIQKKAEDNLESCDMDIDMPPSDKEVECINIKAQVEAIKEKPIMSPTLIELESKKLKLLEQLTTEDSDNSQAEIKNVSEVAYQTIDVTGTVDELANTTEINDSLTENEKDNGVPASPTSNLIKTSSFGTPILKSASPYCRLPCPENFSKDVSEVINFENLPNSTGKYEQMVGVLEKVRKTLKSFNEQQS